MTAADIEREAITWGMEAIRTWAPDEIIAVLEDAALLIEDARLWCDHCGEEITGDSVSDPETVSWLSDGAERFCCRWCLEAREQRAIDAEGGAA